MDSEMQFGDLEEAVPRTALRPDRNRHFAVRAIGQPLPEDLPVFIELDALRQMEYHALSDMNVELGGVMLGGQYFDADSHPFVLVTDVLQAEHYESTKGSFKFTHDTWSEITRQMTTFPEEMQIVGWYHTHPDWGVFISGMDMFICENFFNKPLDVAFVIDPCRGDRGMFYWRQVHRGDKQRAAGFYVIASRFREDELEVFVQQLEEPTMSTRTRSLAPPAGAQAPVVHILERNSSGLMTAVLGMLVMQFCLVALLAWRMGAIPVAAANPEAGSTTDVRRVLDDWMADQRRVLEADAKLQVVDELLARTGQGDSVASDIADRDLEITQLKASLLGLESARTKTDKELKEAISARQSAERRIETLGDKLTQKDKSLEKQRIKVSELEDEVAKLRGEPVNGDKDRFALFGNTWLTLAAVVGAITILGIGAVISATIVARRQNQEGNRSEQVEDYDTPSR